MTIVRQTNQWYYHEVECNCGVWTKILVPKRVPRTLLDDLFTCGFCANKKIAELETKLNNVTQQYLIKMTSPMQRFFETLKTKIKQELLSVVFSGTEPDDHENNLVRNILKDINAVGVQPTPRKGVGKKNLEEKQPLIVSFGNKTDREMVLKKAKNLKDIYKYEKIYINPDRTKSEQESFKKLLAELKKKRAEETDQSFKYNVRDNKIFKFVGKENPNNNKSCCYGT